jgi:hypothetical protein
LHLPPHHLPPAPPQAPAPAHSRYATAQTYTHTVVADPLLAALVCNCACLWQEEAHCNLLAGCTTCMYLCSIRSAQVW